MSKKSESGGWVATLIRGSIGFCRWVGKVIGLGLKKLYEMFKQYWDLILIMSLVGFGKFFAAGMFFLVFGIYYIIRLWTLREHWFWPGFNMMCLSITGRRWVDMDEEYRKAWKKKKKKFVWRR